jgi:hypothetical protein
MCSSVRLLHHPSRNQDSPLQSSFICSYTCIPHPSKLFLSFIPTMAYTSDRSPEIITSRPSSRAWSLDTDHPWHGRCLLLMLSILIIIAMIIGTIFAAHRYYHEWGGQGFLKARSSDDQKDSNNPCSCLPLRCVIAREAPGVHRFEHVRGTKMSSVPPFYSCRDQQNSCEAYGLPVGPDIRDT